MSEAEFPPTERSYQLRFTHRALDDLRCPGLVPSDLEGVQAATPWPGIVHDFREQRGDSPETTGGALANTGRGDIYPLHGPAGGRAATWYDEQSEVCWFLGFTPAHDYAALETRAANDDLLPDIDDETLLETENEELDFDLRVRPGLQRLVADALDSPNLPVRGTVGQLLRLEVTVIAVSVDGVLLTDLLLIVHLPVPVADAEKPPEWPGTRLLTRLAELATGQDAGELQLDALADVPTPEGARAVDPTAEVGIAVRNWEP